MLEDTGDDIRGMWFGQEDRARTDRAIKSEGNGEENESTGDRQ